MQERGRLQVGKVADITLFDPVTIMDNFRSKVGENGISTTGIPYVVVNGTIVVRDSEVLPSSHLSYSLGKGQLERSSHKRKRTTCNIAIFP